MGRFLVISPQLKAEEDEFECHWWMATATARQMLSTGEEKVMQLSFLFGSLYLDCSHKVLPILGELSLLGKSFLQMF